MSRVEPIGRVRTRQLLATTSLVALLAVAATPRALAAPCTTTITGFGFGCTNPSGVTLSRIAISNATVFGGNVSNSGVITPGGITVTDSTIFGGEIIDSGTITGGIAVDGQSTIAAGLYGPAIVIDNTTTFGGGVANAGTLTSDLAGVSVDFVSTFTGGITNSGSISAGINTVASTGNGIAVKKVSTFTGGITNSGTIAATRAAILVQNVTNFGGGITNSGTLSVTGTLAGGPTRAGIAINRVTHSGQTLTISSFGGGIANSGTIDAGGVGISVDAFVAFTGVTYHGSISTFSGGIANTGLINVGATGIFVGAVSSFAGGISNGGTISAADYGIYAHAVSLFSGNVANGGTILAAKTGIVIGGIGSLGISTFTGDIANSGTISAASGNGIFVEVASFLGGITNSGTISNRVVNGITQGGIDIQHVESFAGGIDNSGTISTTSTTRLGGVGVFVENILSFGGGIANSGNISAPSGAGILVNTVTTFAGGIGNSGTISAGVTGINIQIVTTFAGGIGNSGTILAGDDGIYVKAVSTFSGNISNSGTITARTGILVDIAVTFASGSAIVNTGNITGSTAAINLSNAQSAVTVDQEGGTIAGAIELSAFADQLNISGGAIAGNIVGQNAGDTINFNLGSGTFTYANTISQVNTIDVNSGTVQLNGTIDNATSGTALTIAAAGTLLVGTGGNVVPAAITDNGAFGFDQSGAFSFANVISGTGLVEQLGPGTTTLTGTNLYSGGTVIDGGTLAVSADDNLGAASGGLTFGGGTLQFLAGFTDARTITLNAGGGGFDTDGNNDTLSGNIGGVGGLTKIGAGILTLSGTSSYTGATDVNAGTLQAGSATAFAMASTFTLASGAILDLNGFNQTIGELAGGGDVTLGAATLTAGGNNTSTTFSGTISGTGGFDKAGSGTLTLTGTDSYSGATGVEAGALEVNGMLTATSSVSVSGGATLSGDGTIDPLTVTIAGTLSPGLPGVPGTSMSIVGNLAFQSGALYVIYLNPSATTFADVSGTASLAGTVQANFATGAYVNNKPYDILHSGGLNGTTFSGLTTANMPNFETSLSYTPTDVFLDLSAALGSGAHLNVNEQNVATTLNNYFNSGGTLPTGLASVFNFTGANLASALTQLDGEDATGAETSSFQLMNEFLNLMLDPSSGGGLSGGGALSFAPDRDAGLPPDVALAYASILKAPPPASFARRWTAWGSAFGAGSSADGNGAIGSTTLTASDYGFAGGMDYHLDPSTLYGFAVAGAGTDWGLAQGLGSGRSDAFEAGAYSKHYFGPAYVAASLGLGNNWFSTSRNALGEQLTANFQGQSYGARFEGGYRFGLPGAAPGMTAGITPYAALQTQWFHTPAYSETDLTGGGFGLSYNPMSANDTRSELGARFDELTTFETMPLILRGRLAWAHDWVNDPSLNASFESLPGSSFTVFGAPIAHDSALTSASAQWLLTPNWSFTAKFDGAFAGGYALYGGTGTLRYTW